MAHSFLIFDFGKNEEAAQQARHKVEGWKQGFRLGNKITIKFEREGTKDSEATATDHPEAADKRKDKAASKSVKKTPQKDESETDANVRMLVRLDFSDHEKLSHQRWLDRIPTEEPFKSVEFEMIRSGDPDFGKNNDLFETLP